MNDQDTLGIQMDDHTGNDYSFDDQVRDQPHIKDFEEFLDPNVLEDEDFRMNEMIMHQL